MQYRAAGLLFFLLVAAGGMVACSGGSSGFGAGALPPQSRAHGSPNSPIQHVIVVIQENRSFDNFFATFPGANGTTTGLAEAMPSPVASACAEASPPQQVITSPTSIPLTKVTLQGDGFPGNFDANFDMAHDYLDGYLFECDSAAKRPSSTSPCKMDGFDVIHSGADGEGPPMCTYPYQYVDPRDIKPYWTMAKQYVLADDAFQTQGSESFTAHQELIAGGTADPNGITKASIIDDPSYFPWGCDGNKSSERTDLLTIYGQYEGFKGPFPCLTYPNGTIRDLLDANKITWKFYANQVFSWKKGEKKAGGPGIWSAFDAISAVRYSKEWGTNVTFTDLAIFNDIKNGQLPAVSWVTPNEPNSDHPAEASDTGPSWVASIVNAIGRSKYWNSSAVVVLWDDWGGYYDHVAPPLYDNQGGLGFRFPMLIISPYVAAHVEHTQYETTSVLRFIEDNWNLGTLGQEDARATGIENAFNFKQSPRPFHRIRAKYSQAFFLHQKPSGYPPDTE
ncbi:MAG: hypothetical protein JO113_07525 [Candidatus Eremiobacteraeota bacterium]|nr:hypothetical protein [Candidatus Eremiobacteraeota bacterium]